MKIDADAGASRERSQARDTKYRRNGRVARIPRINVFPVSAASVEVRSGRIPGDAARGCPTYIAQKRSASPRLEIYPSTCPSKSCGVVDLADGTRRRRHAERVHKKRKKKRKMKKQRKKKKKCGRFYFLKHDGRRYPQARDNEFIFTSQFTCEIIRVSFR